MAGEKTTTEAVLADVKRELEDLRQFMDIGEASVVVDETEDIDWINNWKQYFHQFYIDDILVIPSWENIKPEDTDKMVLHIDPGTAFGTGMHETTQLCIRQLRKYVNADSEIIDVGTGSGILGIAALKLGAKSVFGTDLDENAIVAVGENLESNHIPADRFHVVQGNIIDDKAVQDEAGYECYDIAVANILAPVIIMLYTSLVNRKLPEVSERIALVLAFGGVILIATHGDLTQLTVSKTTLFLGLASALATVFYNLLPGNLMSEYGTFAIVGWGMLISGIGLIPIVRPWTITAQIIWDWQTFLCVMVVIIMGTVLSFGCYMEGLRLIGGTRASLFASVEPLTATLASVLFMGVSFEFMDLLGFAGIIGAVIILSLPGKKKN